MSNKHRPAGGFDPAAAQREMEREAGLRPGPIMPKPAPPSPKPPKPAPKGKWFKVVLFIIIIVLILLALGAIKVTKGAL